MPRGGSRSRSRSPPPRSTNTATRPPPQQQPQTQTQQPRTGMLGGLGGMIMQGMAFGAGSEVAHQAVRGVMGSDSHSQQQQQPQQYQQQQQPQQQYQHNPCQLQVENFSECLQRNSDISYCQNFSDMLKQCKESHGLQ